MIEYNLNLADLLISLFTLATILIVVYWNRKQYQQVQIQISNQNDQIRSSFFSEYTRRYQEIILNLPLNLNDNDFSLTNLKESDSDSYSKTIKYLRAYYDLCAEEFFLHQNDKLDQYVWKEWKEGMTSSFKLIGYKDGWKVISSNCKREVTMY